ncbi:hypothetical protein PHYSODRAFT_333216 [Phytophthora sojae]|uniref:RING-type domain-containing protein n=1 Tax=Phytophthora sojae (strain P6497) TaxID=1094619 RepID=G4ZL07_PHYSP|nr:hypothetical protein PHYSODRAFT_333216 [Phytophthora sojae]EGZ14925.1 hypothetical protein PHYSODRAFT_333216 [Phytophthora sojae]|eukprot:XP_009528674.1 hypothetical protein PHYSODRAFT_333216 [Phytophthora sojae]
MMYSPELSMALAHRQRRRASTSACKRSLTEGAVHGATSGPSGSGRSLLASTSSRLSFSGRKSGGFDASGNDLLEDAQVPTAVKCLELVTLELSVTKKHADVRYVMTVRHCELNAAWRHARSFDEYRKLQQRLLKKLQHGHFCDADCPWLYGFLKSYFPKKFIFTFSNDRVVEQRKQTLERFFAALYGFLSDRKNFCCSVVMTTFADELVEFIYGDALQQYGLENPVKSSVLEPEDRMLLLRGSADYSAKWEEPATPQKLPLMERESFKQQQQQQISRQSSLTNSLRGSLTDDDVVNDLNAGNCGICGSPLCGVAFGSSSSSSALTVSSLEDSSRSIGSNAVPPLSRSSSNSTGSNSGVFNPPWLGTLKPPGNNGGSANSFGGSRRSSSSASRRRAATYYLTTLSCGHQFHDECIVPKLNESLKCPTCGRIQTND